MAEVSNDINLVLAGNLSLGASEILRTIKDLNLEKKVNLIGYVPMNDLPCLYSEARGFLFPTFYEGFGIPILEAMLCRIPVLIGNRGAAPEIAGDYAVVVDPFDIESIAEGIKQVLEVDESSLAAAAEHAGKFTWAGCAEQTIEVYKRFA
jgi:glycosyltransferase involved in cell wall biosynthesis